MATRVAGVDLIDPAEARFQVMPPELRKTGDAFDVELTATVVASGTTPLRSRSAVKRSAAPGDVHLDLLAAESTRAPQWTTSAAPSLAFELAPKAGELPVASHSLFAFTSSATGAHQWRVALSEAWRQAANAQRYTLPDLSSLPHGAGFALSPTMRTTWSQTRVETTVSRGDDDASQSIAASGTLDAMP